MMKRNTTLDQAVSPVIGILLMLVITVIIAAVVSGFSANFVQGQQKVPQAQITGEFSVHDGFTIRHSGGDPIATSDMVVTIRNSRLFGPGVEQRSIQLVPRTMISDSAGENFWLNDDATIGVTSFNAGETALINASNCRCDVLQPIIVPMGGGQSYPDHLAADGFTYTGDRTSMWALCFKNMDNVGKTFIMDISDRATGKLISTANVPIKP